MATRSRVAQLAVVACAILLIAGCGGNSSSSSGPSTTPSTPPPPQDARITGALTSSTRALDQFAAVEFVAQSGTRAKATVANDGTYAVTLPGGMYRVVAQRPGYEPREQAGFTVTAGQPGTLNLALNALPRVTYIGHDQCAVCHKKEYDGYIQSGHAWKIKKIQDGKQPAYPDGTDRSPVFAKITGCKTGDAIFGTERNVDCPKGWGDIAYTLGGVYKMRFILKDGHVMGGTRAQYDVPGTSYLMNGLPPDGNATSYTGQKYDCGGCHTTGFMYSGAPQDGLPGIKGNWKHEGIQCEACHGAGAAHAQSKAKADITRKRMTTRRTVADLRSADEGFGQAISCYECHGRDSNRNLRGTADWPSGFDRALSTRGIVPRQDPMGGRIRVVNSGSGTGLIDARTGDQVWTYWPEAPANKAPGRTAPVPVDQELTLARSNSFLSSHGDCSTCHNLHGSSRAEKFIKNDWYKGPKGVDRSNEGCMRCHALHDPKLRLGGMKDVACVDCHAPYVSFNGTFIAGAGQRPPLGDNPAHVWTINLGLDRPVGDPLPQYTNQLLATPTKNGFLYPYLTADLACRNCHHDQSAIPGINGVKIPGSYPAEFPVTDAMLRAISFRMHNNLPAR